MPGLRDLWHRFRPIGTPGAPSAAGVPADQRARAEAELEPVFAVLAKTDETCAELRRIGAALARARLAAAHAEADLMIAEAEQAVAAERADAAAEVEARGRADLARDDAATAEATTQVRERAQALLPLLVRDAIGQMRADITALTAVPGGRSRPERP